ncbi:CLUMA_CG002111, isoform A, partial [Clunio marinus]
ENKTESKPEFKKIEMFFKPTFDEEEKKPRLLSLEPDEKIVKKYSRGSEKIKKKNIETSFFKRKISRQEEKYEFAVKQAARAAILMHEDEGYLIPDEGEDTTEFTQDDIKQNVDITSASKIFKLNLDQFGPYKINYTRNGRHLLLGGKRGHIAAFDWITKKLNCEFSVMEEIYDVKWLHLETLFAVAQKKWVHFYDNKGTEIHCVKRMHNVNQLEFLPYHFLLASGSSDGWLKWLDVSIGEIVSEFHALDGKITMMKQNPSNAVICIGGAKGVVSMWSPSVKEPLASILCHPTPITALGFNPSGDKMVTTGIDRKIKLWDTRTFKEPLTTYMTRTPVSHVSLSQKDTLAVTMGNICEIFRNKHVENTNSMYSYLRNVESGSINSVEFVPYEDVVGLGTSNGFSSILVPGSGEANFDALEQNPFRTKNQRREHEVKALLEKIPADLISLDATQIVGVDIARLEQKLEAKSEINIPMAELKDKKRKSGIQKFKTKQIHMEQRKQHLLKFTRIERLQEMKSHKRSEEKEDEHVLDRFKKRFKK